jgi:hypothetical protein
MTPREKAINLVAQFTSKWFGNSVEANTYVIENIPEYGTFDQFFTAKECAILAVNQVIEELIVTDFDNRFPYWIKVKEEIVKL